MVTAAGSDARAREPMLHELPLDEALDRRWRRGVMLYRGGNSHAPFKGDAAVEAFEEFLDCALYLAEARRLPGLSRAFLHETERTVRRLARQLQRALLARDNGGICPPNHPALPVHPATLYANGKG